MTAELSVRRQTILQCQDQETIMGLEQGPSRSRQMRVPHQVEVTTVPSRLWHTRERLEVGPTGVGTGTTTKEITSMTSCRRAPDYIYQVQQDVSF